MPGQIEKPDMEKISIKIFRKNFYITPASRRFGWSSVLLAITANVLIFLSIGWVNRLPDGHPPEDYDIIEVFKPQIVPENRLTEIAHTPIIVETGFQPKPLPMKLIQKKEILFRPHLMEWMPDLLLKLPGVGIDMSLVEFDSPDLNAAVAGDALAINQVDQPPRKISGSSPVYPIWAKAQKEEGTVTLRFIVDIDGRVKNIQIHSIRGDERFAIAAGKAVESWRFKPAINRGKPAAVWCFQKIHFKFED